MEPQSCVQMINPIQVLHQKPVKSGKPNLKKKTIEKLKNNHEVLVFELTAQTLHNQATLAPFAYFTSKLLNN